MGPKVQYKAQPFRGFLCPTTQRANFNYDLRRVLGYGHSMDFLFNLLLMSWCWGTMDVAFNSTINGARCQLGNPQFTTSAILSGDAPNWSCSNSMSRGIIDIPFYVVRQKYIWYWCTIDTIRILGYKRHHQGLVSRVSRLEKDGIIELSSPFLLCENLWWVENKGGEGRAGVMEYKLPSVIRRTTCDLLTHQWPYLKALHPLYIHSLNQLLTAICIRPDEKCVY